MFGFKYFQFSLRVGASLQGLNGPEEETTVSPLAEEEVPTGVSDEELAASTEEEELPAFTEEELFVFSEEEESSAFTEEELFVFFRRRSVSNFYRRRGIFNFYRRRTFSCGHICGIRVADNVEVFCRFLYGATRIILIHFFWNGCFG